MDQVAATNKKDRGQPREFENEQAFLDAILEYVTLCNTKWLWIPTITGFCVHRGITRETFYQQKQYYSDAYKKGRDMIENAVWAHSHVSDALKIFYLKNAFNYADKIDHTQNIEATIETKPDFSKLSVDELKVLKEIAKKVSVK